MTCETKLDLRCFLFLVFETNEQTATSVKTVHEKTQQRHWTLLSAPFRTHRELQPHPLHSRHVSTAFSFTKWHLQHTIFDFKHPQSEIMYSHSPQQIPFTPKNQQNNAAVKFMFIQWSKKL